MAVSSFENATAEKIVETAQTLGTLSVKDVNQIVVELAKNPLIKPVVEDARSKMASRDNALRNVYHGNLVVCKA